MSYEVDELFRIEEYVVECAVFKYLKKDDPAITEVEIPAEYKGKPVTHVIDFCGSKHLKRVVVPPSVSEIHIDAFAGCESLETAELSEGLMIIGDGAFRETGLKSVVLPKSLKKLCWGAFRLCRELERVEFGGSPWFGTSVFEGCPKLPPETIAMGLVRSTDITAPLYKNHGLLRRKDAYVGCFRPDVFELMSKNNCFQNLRLDNMFYQMIDYNKPELFPIAEKYGLLEDAALIDKLLSYVIENQKTEITAYLLQLKKRKFGFEGGSGLEL